MPATYLTTILADYSSSRLAVNVRLRLYDSLQISKSSDLRQRYALNRSNMLVLLYLFKKFFDIVYS